MIRSGLNFRRLGRSRRLFRSGDLTLVNDADIARLVEVHGLARAIDLRSESELHSRGRPDKLIRAGVRWFSRPLRGADDEFRRVAQPHMSDYFALYSRILESESEAIRSAVACVASEGCATAIACTAGKDRTGVLAAIILGLLGEKVEQIAADFSRSGPLIKRNASLLRGHWQRKGLTRAQYICRFECAPQTMVLLCDHVKERFDGWNAYATWIGLRRSEIAAIRDFFSSHWTLLGR